MTHILPRALNALAGLSLTAGIVVSGSLALTQASLSAPGSTLLDSGGQLHAATVIDVYQSADAGIQLIAGILLVLLGFFLHALARTRSGERPVHITVKPSTKRRMWFWIEMRV